MASRLIEFRHLGRGVQFTKFLEACSSSHDVRFRYKVLNLDETEEFNISDQVISGQVDVDATSDPQRKMQMLLMDPDSRVSPRDPTSPAFGNLWAGSLVQVWYDIYVDAIPAWVGCPVFTGPVSNFSRDGAILTVTCVSKDWFLMPPNAYQNAFSATELERNGRTRKGALKALLDGIGEPQNVRWDGTRGDLPRSFDAMKSFHTGDVGTVSIKYGTGKEKKDREYFTGRDEPDSILNLARAICSAQNQFWYDGEGIPRVRKQGAEGTFDVKDFILTDVATTFDVTEVRNRSRALILKKPPSMVTVVLKPNDPMSPRNLGRSGKNRYLDAGRVDGEFKSNATARDAAGRALVSSEIETATFDMLPAPWLEPGDHIRIEDSSGRAIRVSAQVWSLGLNVGDSMSFGYQRKLIDPKHAMAKFQKLRMKHVKKEK